MNPKNQRIQKLFKRIGYGAAEYVVFYRMSGYTPIIIMYSNDFFFVDKPEKTIL